MNNAWRNKLSEAREFLNQGQEKQALQALLELESLVEDALDNAHTNGQNNMLEAGYHL